MKTKWSWWRWWRRQSTSQKLKLGILGAGLVLFILLSLGGIVALAIIQTLPSDQEIGSRQVAQSTKIYDRTGKILLYEIHGEERRTIVPFNEIPDTLKQATIALEDQSFYAHPAFDWRSIARAVLADVLHFQKQQGGSTITQQLAKNAFLSDEKTITRKVKELFLALRLEKRYTKDEILNLYLNQIPYGANAYGVEAAAKTFFGKDAKDLTLAESALIAALPQAPSYYSPWGVHVDELTGRKDYALEQMAKLGDITDAEKKAAQAEKLSFQPQASGIKAPHFVMAVQDYLIKKYGNDALESGGLNVITTVDMRLQEIAEKAVAEGAARNWELYKGKNAALFAEDPKTGQVLAMVGSKDYFNTEDEGNFNVATQGLRQPGSSFKPLAYVTAFKKGYTPDTILFDLQTEFDTTGIPEQSYQPNNFDNLFRGPISLRNALAQSVNIPAVKIMYLAGIDNVLKTAKDFGITTLTERSRYGLSLVLGGGEVKLSEMVGAYSVFANEGIHHDQTLVLSVQDAGGKVLEQFEDKADKVIEPQYTRLISDILSDIQARAPLYAGSLDLTVFPNRDVALKTGTTNNYVDAWSIGYTPSLVAGVWAGNNHREPLQRKGGSVLAAVPIWSAFMKAALTEYPEEVFTKPDPMPEDKPILRSDYTAGNQLHTILYYVNKNDPAGPPPANPEGDPQFDNWESAVQKWGRATIPNFDSLFNQAGSSVGGAFPSSGNIPSGTQINISSPQQGAFIQNPFSLNFDAQNDGGLQTIEIYWNENLVERIQVSGNSYSYVKALTVPSVNSQNLLRIKVVAQNGSEKTAQVIVYK
jgi:1A family penicillin-binding protein